MYNGKQILNLTSTKRLDSHIRLSEVKHNLHIGDDETDDDVRIAGAIESALTASKNFADHYFALTELSYQLYNFSGDTYKLRISPISSLEVFEVSDDEMSWTDITDDVFIEKRESDFTFHFKETLAYDYIRFTIRVGYLQDELPEDARAAVIIKASDLFDTESSSYIVKLENNHTFENLLSSYSNRRW